MAIERKKIVAEAIALLDEVGYDNLTTRRLAERLGVKQPALYWHFKNKRALFDAIDEAILAPHHAAVTPRAGDDWRVFLVSYGESIRRALLAHRDGGRVHAGAPPSHDQLGQTDAQITLLCGAGFSPLIAMQALLTINAFVLGSVIDQQADEEHGLGWDKAETLTDGRLPAFEASLTAMQEGGRDAAFTAGLEMIVTGLDAMRQKS